MKILLSGANGYIGRRLLPVLVEQGHEVICLVRDVRRLVIEDSLQSKVTLLEADLLQPNTLTQIPNDIDIAFYLVHSMNADKGDALVNREVNAAFNFVEALNSASCQQIIYLSGIANDTDLSEHLHSRKEVERVLASTRIPLTVLRAAIIIGSGGASFEIIRDLVEKLPVMVAPRWLKTCCQPIAVRNVIEYLCLCMANEKTFGRVFDIGGPDILTYREMLLQFAEIRGLRRWIFTLPVLTPRLSSYWLYFITSTSYPLAKTLVNSMRNEVIVKEEGIEAILKIERIPYKQAVQLAFNKIAQNEVVSSWIDAFASSHARISLTQFVQVPVFGCFVDYKKKLIERPIEEVLDNVWAIGGQRGWYAFNWLWKIRGYLDKLIGGVGLRRGRRSPTDLAPGDALDFWRVLVADKVSMRLLLYAEMKLPGDAWLEFRIKEEAGHWYLHQKATFRPRGVMGRLYWYSIMPFHLFIFQSMINSIHQFHRTE